MTLIHPTAVVSPDARVAADVAIGPFAVVEADVTIGAGCRIAAHSVIKSGTDLGENNQVHESAVLGGIPQHLGLTNEMGRLRVGADNIFREYVTVHRAWKPGAETRVGSRNMVMVSAHIAHDCQLGDEIILANNVMLAGHVVLGDRAYISGAVGVHQFCRIGRNAMVGGQAHVTRDVPPFVTVDGDTSRVVGLNLIGLRRAGFSAADVQQLKKAYRLVFRQKLPWEAMLEALERDFREGPAAQFALFLRNTTRGVIPPRRERESDAAREPAAERPTMTVRFPEEEAA